MLLAEGAFAAGMIFSFLKLVHIFSVNPHLGPLQISLGRMIIDIVKFFFIYSLVLFAFGCGLNQLLWYYAELEKNKCFHLPSGLPDFEGQDKSCTIWRRYSNLFETSQSLFWASFGLIDLVSFELAGIKGFTRFWALLMFGSYSVINIIVLLNMLIAMMSNSYQIISERSDTEWKFARSRLWVNYFDDGDTLPPPFNILPTPKIFLRSLGCSSQNKNTMSFKNKSREQATAKHEMVMKLLVRRYVTAEQRKRDDYGITEDDVMEIRQDISSLRYELIDILRKNGMRTPEIDFKDVQVSGKKGKVMERRLLKDFHIGMVEGLVQEMSLTPNEPKNVFGQIAKVIGRRTTFKPKKKDWNALVKRNSVTSNPIGSAQELESLRFKRQSLRKHILLNVKDNVLLEDEKLIEYNPKLSEVPRGARLAYAKFMSKKIEVDYNQETDKKEDMEISRQNVNESRSKDSVKSKSSVSFIDSTDVLIQSHLSRRDSQNRDCQSSTEDRFTTQHDTHENCLSPLLEIDKTPSNSRSPTPIGHRFDPPQSPTDDADPNPIDQNPDSEPPGSSSQSSTEDNKTERSQSSSQSVRKNDSVSIDISMSVNEKNNEESGKIDVEHLSPAEIGGEKSPSPSNRSKLTGKARTGWI
ncbi:unnamed protein product [Phaedon cochleariae]|uniref:Ion transport domain-containing protein n=1 Tax=Phaedon cochleariae TaxID=80249 RepID=A0A9P0GSM5_PHACE|nr:unnamed protein product [Phaedon cochleariae]